MMETRTITTAEKEPNDPTSNSSHPLPLSIVPSGRRSPVPGSGFRHAAGRQMGAMDHCPSGIVGEQEFEGEAKDMSTVFTVDSNNGRTSTLPFYSAEKQVREQEQGTQTRIVLQARIEQLLIGESSLGKRRKQDGSKNGQPLRLAPCRRMTLTL